MLESTPIIWAKTVTEAHEFRREQDQLGRVWTLLGINHDVAHDGDWFCATLGGRSIFVQRFGVAIKVFENRCAHRFFPLRTAKKGKGAVVCDFHHWRYDQDGRAVGIPMCPEMFGTTPRDLNARLKPVEIATCGSLIFGRFASDAKKESLADYLGDGFPILEAMCEIPTSPNYIEHTVAAHWKLLIHITLDDYHIVAVHPGTFGKGGYLKNDIVNYFRFGLHSAYFTGGGDTLSSMAADCRNGNYRPLDYRIFNIFPNLSVSLFWAAPYWYAFAQQFVPLAPGRTLQRGWFYRTKMLANEEGILSSLIRPIYEPIRARIVRHYIDKITREDNVICEALQSVAHQADGAPILGKQEQRIGWFEESYARAMNPMMQSDASKPS